MPNHHSTITTAAPMTGGIMACWVPATHTPILPWFAGLTGECDGAVTITGRRPQRTHS